MYNIIEFFSIIIKKIYIRRTFDYSITKNIWYNDKFDLDGGVLEIKYTDKTTEKVDLNLPNIKVVETKDDVKSDTTKEVVVDYGGKQSSFSVTVSDPKVVIDTSNKTKNSNNL